MSLGIPTYARPSSSIPAPIASGMKMWRTESGVAVLRLHYTADPERCTDEWLSRQVRGYVGGADGRDWRREMEIDFQAYAGAPVYPGFSSDCVHETAYNPALELWRGWDFGYRHPAVTWWQLWPADDTLVCLAEWYPTLDPIAVPGVDAQTLGRQVKSETARRFPEAYAPGSAPIRDYGDPSGKAKKDTSELSTVEQLSHLDIDMEWRVLGRKSRIHALRRYVETPGRFRIDPHCRLTIKGFAGAYRYQDRNSRGEGPRDPDMPDVRGRVQEEPYIHLMDSAEYMAAVCLPTEWKLSAPGGEYPVTDITETQPLFSSPMDLLSEWYQNRHDIPDDLDADDMLVHTGITLETEFDLSLETE